MPFITHTVTSSYMWMSALMLKPSAGNMFNVSRSYSGNVIDFELSGGEHVFLSVSGSPWDVMLFALLPSVFTEGVRCGI